MPAEIPGPASESRLNPPSSAGILIARFTADHGIPPYDPSNPSLVNIVTAIDGRRKIFTRDSSGVASLMLVVSSEQEERTATVKSGGKPESDSVIYRRWRVASSSNVNGENASAVIDKNGPKAKPYVDRMITLFSKERT